MTFRGYSSCYGLTTVYTNTAQDQLS